jgi:predicted ABC-type ATPase
VAERVAHGGHSIPLSDIRRRFPRSLRHLLRDFSSRVDRCTCFMNHAVRPVLVFERNGPSRTIHAPSWYRLLLHEAQP